jgi:hypothetical protein
MIVNIAIVMEELKIVNRRAMILTYKGATI